MIRNIHLAIMVMTTLCIVDAVPSFSIYNNITIATSTFGMQLWGDRPDLAATSKYFPSTTESYFCVSGIWALHYQVENYGSGTTWPNPGIFRDGCTYFIPLQLWVGSARIVGEVGVRRLNLYSGPNYKHIATVLTSSLSTVSTKFESIILVGSDSVQLYLQPNYGGLSYCLPARGTSYNVVSNIASIGLEAGDIRSVRFGCALNANIIESQPESVHVQAQSTVGVIEEM